MRVLLVQSFTVEDDPPIFPLGLAYIAAYLESHQIKAIDLNIEKQPMETLQKVIHDFSPQVIGVSLRNIKIARPGKHFNCLEVHQNLLKEIRKFSPSAIIVCGGTAFSLFAREFMELVPQIDFGLFGEAEASFPTLLNNLNSPQKVPGILYKKDGEIIDQIGLFIPPPFDRLPRRDLFNLQAYTDDQAIGVQTKRGCILNCIHCSDRYLTGQKLRIRPADEVVREIKELKESYGVKYIFFADQVFNIPYEHALEICLKMKDECPGIKWTAWFNEHYLDEDLAKAAKEAGCYQLTFSPDAVSDSTLKVLKKNINSLDLEKSVDIAKKVQIPVTFNFMVNGPGENLTSLIRLIFFIIKAKFKLKGLLKLHGLFITLMRIYPHTELAEIAKKEKLIEDHSSLLEPIFYNPPPLKYLVNSLLLILTLLWKAKKWLKHLKKNLNLLF